MKNIVVTGASGFIGTALLRELSRTYRGKARVIPLTSATIPGYQCFLHKDWTFEKRDFIDAGIMTVDVLIHLGGFVSKTKEDIVDAGKHFSTIENTMHLLKNLPNVPRKIICCSTITVYGDVTKGLYRRSVDEITEDSFPNPQNYYGYVKYCCELMIRDWCSKNGCLCQILRLCPVFGKDEKKKAIYKMIAKAAGGEDIVLTIDPGMRRNMIYVDDCCRFISNAVEIGEDFGIINVGSETNYTYQEIVETIVKVSGGRIRWHVDVRDTAGQDLIVNQEKRIRYLGREQYTLEDAVRIIYNSIC